MENKINKINILEFSEYPGPRYCNQGSNSGEEFYHNILNNAFAESLNLNKTLEVNLDGVAGYASSFLDEAFGNLVYDFTAEKVKSNLRIISIEESDWIDMIFNEITPEWEDRRLKGIQPKKTSPHDSWFKFQNGQIIKL